MKLFEDAWIQKGVAYLREYDTDLGKSVTRPTTYKSEYYVPDKQGKYRGFLDNVPLRKVQGSSYNVDNAYGARNARYVAIREEHFGKDTFNKKPNTWFLDIETSVATQPGSSGFPDPENALEPIVLIQFWDTKTNKGYVLGLEEWYYRKDYKYDFEVEYIKYDSEKDLLKGFIKLFKEQDPFLIYAWNGEQFDFPYIFNRFKNLGISWNNLSNHGTAKLTTKQLTDNTTVYDVESQGHQFLDLMKVYQKFVFDNVPNYSLDTIGEKEIGIKKVNHDNYVKFDDFRIGKYVITGKETPEQKQQKIYKAAKLLETLDKTDPNYEKLEKYIKQKSYSDFVDYGVRDFVILKGIHDARNFTQLMTTMASKMGCLLQDTLGTLKAWDSYITSFIAKDKKIAPPHHKSDKKPNVVGGFVREPEVGKHRWILSSDVNSMYPLLGMASFNMSPETFVPFDERPDDLKEINQYLGTQDEDKILAITPEQWEKIKAVAKKYNVALGVGGAVYKKDSQGVVPQLVTEIYKGRKIAKKEMFKYEQMAIDAKAKGEDTSEFDHLASLKETEQMTAKIQINSLYGAIASDNFSMFNEKIAQSITGNGRYFIKMLANNIEQKLQSMMPSDKPYIIAGDTDSVYFQIANFVDKYTKDKSITQKTKWSNSFYIKVIEAIVQKTISDLAENLNAFDPSYIGAEREIIADSGLFVAKKKYTARVRDNEGKIYPEDDPYIKIQGLDIIKGGTPNFSKKYLKQAIPVILDKTEKDVIKWFDEVKKDFLNWSLDDIAKTQGVSKVYDPEWGTVKNGRKVSIPFGSRVCVVSNTFIQQNNLQDQFPIIEAGEKVKILFLHQPNPLRSEAFAFTDVRFAEKFKDYIDYDTTFEKFFVKPLEGMLEAAGIELNKRTQELDAW